MRYVLIKRAAELTGYSVQAIESKIAKSQWLEGLHYKKAPDGRVFIDLEEIERWIIQGSMNITGRSGSRSSGKASAAGRL
jgi:hypothetical protein